MVMFMGLILVVWYASSTIKGGLFRPLFQESRELEQEIRLNPSAQTDEKAKKFAIKMLGVMALGVVVFIIDVSFLLCALKIDILLYPTIFMLVWYVAKFTLLAVSKTERAKVDKQDYNKPNNKHRIKSFISLAYIIYILILIIISL